MDFDRLDRILKSRGLSRRKLAIAVGILPGTMSTAFSRKSGLSSEDVLKIAEYLDISPYYLEGWAEDERAEDITAEQSFRLMGEDLETITRLAAYDDRQRQRLNAAFDKLNATGQHEAVKRVEELTEIPRYTRTDGEQ